MKFLYRKLIGSPKAKFTLVSVVVLFVLSFFLVPSVFAQSGSVAWDLGDAALGSIFTVVVGPAIGAIAAVCLSLIGAVTWILTKILFAVIQYNGFITSQAVSVGWTLTRDMANMFIVLILMAIAIATILRIENYSLKRLLPKLLLMAVLVNFSKLICGVLIDLSQVIMLTFVAGFAAASGYGGSLMDTLKVNKILSVGSGLLKNLKTFGSGEMTVNLFKLVTSAILMVVMLSITVGVIAVMVVVLVLRIVMLWLLVIFSPLAYVLWAYPKTQNYAAQWWSEFTKYIIVGPLLAFFLWLTFAVTSNVNIGKDIIKDENLSSDQSAASLPVNPTEVITEIMSPAEMTSFIIGITLLLASLMFTQQLGVAGGSFAGQIASGIRSGKLPGLGGVGKVSKLPFLYAGRKINEAIGDNRLPTWINPRSLWRGLQQRRSGLYERAKLKADAGGHEAWEKFFTGTTMPRRTMIASAEEAGFAKDFSFMDKEEMAEQAVALNRKSRLSPEIRAKRRGLIRAAAEQGYLDDLMAHPDMRKHVLGIAKNFSKSSPEAEKYIEESKLLKRMEAGEWYGWDQLHLFLQDYLGSDQDGLNTIGSLEGIGAKVKHPEYAGHATYRSEADGGQNQMELETMWDQKNDKGEVVRKSGSKRAITEFFKWPGRQKMSVAPHGILNFSDKGFGLDKFSETVMTAAFAGQGSKVAEHSQNRVWTMIQGGSGDNMNWVKEEELADLTKKVDRNTGLKEGEEVYQRRLAALAHMMEITGQDGRKAMWQKVGGKGTEGKYLITIDGREEEVSASQLVGMIGPAQVDKILRGKKIDLQKALNEERGKIKPANVAKGQNEVKGSGGNASDAVNQDGTRKDIKDKSVNYSEKVQNRPVNQATQEDKSQKSHIDKPIDNVTKERISEAKSELEEGKISEALEHLATVITTLESSLNSIRPTTDDGLAAKKKLEDAVKKLAGLRAAGGLVDQVVVIRLLNDISYNISELEK